MSISVSAIIKVFNEPFEAVKSIDLFYAKDSDLTIRRAGDTPFQYIKGDIEFKEKHRLDEIKGLAIPPAWKNVRIAEKSNAHLQAVGRDAKLRKQYRYHEKWISYRNRTKFAKLLLFGEHLPKIREQVEKDLRLENWVKGKVLALVIKLMEETHIRIGNDQYAKHNQTYGLTTLRKRHLGHDKNHLRFEFVGKRGKEHRITLRNKRLIRLVNQCEEIPGWELFKFFDKNGNKHTVDSGLINDYIQGHSLPIFTAKDFRTWAASLVYFKEVKRLHQNNQVKDPAQVSNEALKAAATALGNTKNVCQKYYVHPTLIERYKDDPCSILGIEKVGDRPFLQQSEAEMMEYIENSKPRFK